MTTRRPKGTAQRTRRRSHDVNPTQVRSLKAQIAREKPKVVDQIEAMNLTAQLRYGGVGNPISAHPDSANSNAHPGLETGFRNAWTRILTGIELNESSNFVMSVEAGADPTLLILESGWRLLSVMDVQITAPVIGPQIAGGPVGPLADAFGDSVMPLEMSNALAEIVHLYAGQPVRCKFQNVTHPNDVMEFELVLRSFFEAMNVNGKAARQAVISRELAQPGEMSQSLCSPWHSDYRECACFYWPATRPDYVNVEPGPDGVSIGHNWLQKGRTPKTPKVYVTDDWFDPALVSFEDLYSDWEGSLGFVMGGKDKDQPKRWRTKSRARANSERAGTPPRRSRNRR